MIRALTLLLPALFPSWRFFPKVEASPRIEFALLGAPDEAPPCWQEFRPRPDTLPLSAMLKRLVWNPAWSEHLYLIRCSERFIHAKDEGALSEIPRRIGADLRRYASPLHASRHFQMRLMLVSRDGNRVMREEVYRSAVHAIDAIPSA